MTTKYWIGNGGNWYDTAHWSLSSGGGGGAAVPTKDDQVIFDSNSITTSGQIVVVYDTIDVCCAGIDFSLITTGFMLTDYVYLNIFNGALELSPLLTIRFLYSSKGFRFVDGACDIYCNSATCELQCFGDYVSTIGAAVIPTITLRDTVTVSEFDFDSRECVFNTNDESVNITDFKIICYEESTVNLGSSIINCSSGFQYNVVPGAVIDAGTSSITVGEYVSIVYNDDSPSTSTLPALNEISFNRALSPSTTTAELYIQFHAYTIDEFTGKFYCSNLTVLPGYEEFVIGAISNVSDICIITSSVNISGSETQQLIWKNHDSYAKSVVRLMMDSEEVNLEYVTLKGISASGTTPTGTTNICIAGIASAFASASGYTPSEAFDGDFGTDWEGDGVPNWIQYDLGAGVSKIAERYIVRAYDIVSYSFVSWTFEGSNDGNNWTILDTQDHTSSIGVFTLNNTDSYRYYKWNVTECGDSNPDATELWILEGPDYADGATFYALTSNGCIDGGGNSGWLFESAPPEPVFAAPIGQYNEGDHMAYAPGDSGGTAVWREPSASSTPVTTTHQPGCGYWFKEVGTIYGGEVGPWVPWNVDQKVEFNEGSSITKSPSVSGGSPIWEVGKTGPAITDTHVPCGYWFKDYDSDSQLRRICLGLEMGYTKTDMVVDEQQALYVKDSNGDTVACPITTWTLSGVGSLSESVGPTTVYTAPSYSGSGADSATITLWCGGAVKDTLVISVAHSCDCLDTIGYTSLQMSVSGSQTLTASGAQDDDCYAWAITSGGGSLSVLTGKSVVYTAPASNANCSSNPTITLSCGGVAIDTIKLAVNADTSGNWAVNTYTEYKCEHIPEDDPYITKVYLYKNQYSCDGSLNPYTGISVDCKFGASANQPGGPPP